MRRGDASARSHTEVVDEGNQVGVIEVLQLIRCHHVAEIHKRRIVVERVRAEIHAETAPTTGEVDMRQAVRIVVAGELGEPPYAAVDVSWHIEPLDRSL